MASQFRMGQKLLHPERFDARGQRKPEAAPVSAETQELFPKHLNGPRWQLSDGSIVRGKRSDAEAAEQKLGQ
jgi:hypothetical protein